MSWGNPKVIDWNEEPVMSMSATFVGTYDPHIAYDYGSICIKDGKLYFFDGINNWTEFCEHIDSIWEAPKLQRKYFHNCPNCGAPMHDHKCLYCGTEDYGN